VVTDHDVVADIIQRLADVLGADVVPPEALIQLEVEIRRDWAGDVYIRGAVGGVRNTEIRDKYRRGMTITRLSAAYGLTERRIRQIVNRK